MRRKSLRVEVGDRDPVVVECPARRRCRRCSRQTRPWPGPSGRPGSPRTPSTARTVDADGRLVATDQDDRRRPCARDVGAGRVDDESQILGRQELLDRAGTPNSRFMNELLVICPTQPGMSPDLARPKNRSMNGTVSAYLPLQYV